MLELINPTGTATRQDILDLFDALLRLNSEVIGSMMYGKTFSAESARNQLISNLNK